MGQNLSHPSAAAIHSKAPRRVHWPVLLAPAQRAAALLYGRPACTVQLADTPWHLRWTADVQPPFALALQCSAGSLRFRVYLSASSWPPDCAPELLLAQPRSAQRFFLTDMLAPLLDQSSAILGREVRVRALLESECRTLPAAFLGLQLQPEALAAVGSAPIRGALCADSAPAWSQLWRALQALPEPPHVPASDPGDSLLTLVLGELPLPAGTVRALAPGDVLLLAALPGQPRGFLLYAPDGQCLGLGRCEPGLRQALFQPLENAMTLALEPRPDEGPDEGPDGAPILSSADAVDLTLRFELGSTRIRLQALRALRPGDCLELDAPLEAHDVLVRCGSHCVARGELLELEGRLCVRLRQLG